MKALIIPLLLAGTVVFSQPHAGRMHRNMDKPGEMHDRIVRQLDLTADQQKEFDKLSSEMMKKGITIRSKISTARVDLKELTSADKPDKSAITSKLAEINKLQGEMQVNHTQFWFDVNNLLTADQQKIWKKALQRPLGGGFAQREGHRMMGPHGRGDQTDTPE